MRVVANGIGIEVDDAGGARGGEPLLLVMGLALQLVAWPEDWLAELRRYGLRPIRFDNRDIGLSQGFDHLGVPSLAWAALRRRLGLAVRAPYTLADMAADTVGVLDALGLPSAHLCGVSMGGMIAQHVAALYPQRVRSLTLMMSSSGARHLPLPAPAVRRALLARPRADDRAAAAEFMHRLLRLVASPAHPPDAQELRERIAATMQRAWHPAGAARQLLAIVAEGDRTPLLARIRAPTLVLHGRADPLIRVAAAHDLAARIAGARLETLEGWGHDLPPALLPALAARVARHALRASG